MTPPPYVIMLAIQQANQSPCRSKRGVIIFNANARPDVEVIANGFNFKPRGFECDGSAECKLTCRFEAVHAEQVALLAAGPRADGAEMVHVKTVGGLAVASEGPSCVQCSKLALVAGIAGVWLLLKDGWRRYDAVEFHAMALEASR